MYPATTRSSNLAVVERPAPRLLVEAPAPFEGASRPKGTARWGSRRSRRWHGLGPTAVSVILHAGVLIAFTLFAVAAPRSGNPESVARLGAIVDIEEMKPEPEPLDREVLPDVQPEELEETVIEPDVAPAVDLQRLPDDPSDQPPRAEFVQFQGPTLATVGRRIRPKQPVVTPPVVVRKPAPRPPAPEPVVRRPAPAPRAVAGARRLVPLQQPLHYPEAARRLGIQGRARVEVTIDPSGRVTEAHLVTSSGSPILDAAAVASARAWRFQPPGEVRRAILPFTYALRG